MKFLTRLNAGILYASLFGLAACSTIENRPDAAEQTALSEAGTFSALERPEFIENENKPDGLTSELVYDLLLSSIAFQQDEIEVALNALIRAAQASQEPSLISRAVRMAIHGEKYDQAYTLGQRWITLQEDNHLAHIVTALAAVMGQKSDEANTLLKSLLAEDKSKTGLRFQQVGEVFLQNAQGETALDVLDQLAEQYPKSAEGWMIVAAMAQKNKNLGAMQIALDKVLTLEPENQNAAGFQLEALSEDQKAQQEFAKGFIKKNPDAIEFRLRYARGLLRDSHDEAALEVLLDLLKHDTDNGEAINLAALLYQSQENHQKAVKYFKLRLKSMPDDDRSRIYLANSLQQLKRYDEAKKQIGKVKDGEEMFGAQRQMALIIEDADGFEKALSYLLSIEGRDETQKVQLIVDQELTLKRAKRTDEALAVLNQGLIQHSGNEILLYHRALLTVEQENLVAHEADMRVLLEREPTNAHYYNTLGYSLLTLSDRIKEAGELIDKAHQLEANDPYILDSKGWVEFKKGNLDKALEFLAKAFELDQDAEIAAHIGEVYWAKGLPDKARDYWQQGDEIDSDNQALQKTKARFLN